MIPKASLFAAAALLAIPFAVPAAAQDIAVGPFKGVGLSAGGRVTLREGATQHVRLIKGNLDCTFIGIERGSAQSLEIKPKRGGHCPQNYALEVEVTAPHFSALAVDSGGAMKAEARSTAWMSFRSPSTAAAPSTCAPSRRTRSTRRWTAAARSRCARTARSTPRVDSGG